MKKINTIGAWIFRLGVLAACVLVTLVVIQSVALLVWFPGSTHGAFERGTDLLLICGWAAAVALQLSAAYTARQTKKMREATDATLAAQTSQAVLIMHCPVCHDPFPLQEIGKHVDQHIADLRNPAHIGVPVSSILRRPGDTEWQIIHEEA